MNKKVHVKPYKRKNPKSNGKHQVHGHTRRIEKNGSYQLHDEVRGASHGQTDKVIKLESDDGIVGFLKYDIYEDEIHIKYVEVDEEHRGKGFAKEMFQELQKRYPDTPINPGMTTDKGSGLIASIMRKEENPEYRKKKNKLESMREEVEEIENMSPEDWNKINNEERMELNDRWNDLSDEIPRLKFELSNIGKYDYYVDLEDG